MVAWDIKKGINNVIEQLKDIKKNGVPTQQEQYEQPEQEVEYAQQDEQHSVIADIEGNFGGITDLVTT